MAGMPVLLSYCMRMWALRRKADAVVPLHCQTTTQVHDNSGRTYPEQVDDRFLPNSRAGSSALLHNHGLNPACCPAMLQAQRGQQHDRQNETCSANRELLAT
jgi:hypothetical protein